MNGEPGKFDAGLDRAIRGAFYVMAGSLAFSISLAQLALGVLIVTTAVRAIRQRRLGFAIGPAGVALLIFLGWVLATWPLSLHPDDAIRRLPKYWMWFVFFVSLAALDSRRMARRALWTMVVCAGVAAIYGIAQHFFCDAVPRIFAKRVELHQPNGNYCHAVGFFDHHLTYGNSLAIIVLLGVGLWLAEPGRRARAILGVALVLSSLALLWTYARSAWLGLLAGLVALGAQLGRRALAAVVLGAFAVGALAYAASPSLARRMQQSVRSDDNLERIYIWKTTLAMIADHPLFGIGPGAYERMTPEYRAGYNIHWTAKGHAHNSYLEYAAESGIPAALLFIAFLATLLAVGANRAIGIKQDAAMQRLRAGAVAGAACFAAASLLQHNGGDTVVCMTFQVAAALVIFWQTEVGAVREPPVSKAER